jgi:Fe-S cluster assembly protein SufD
MALTPWLSHFKTDFELARRRRQESIAFDALRCEAFDRFLLLGCPTQADEEWRYVDITPIGKTNFSLASTPTETARRDQAVRPPFENTAEIELTFINGYFIRELSTIDERADGLLIGSLKAVLGADMEGTASCFAQIANVDGLPLVALNTALFEDGACVLVPPHTAITRPIHVRFVCTGEADARPAMTQPRVLIVVGDRGAATVTESYAGAENVEYFTNAVTEIVLGAGARLEHYRDQRESEAAWHISAAHVVAGPRSTYRAQCVNAGGALARTETMVALAGDAAQCSVAATNVAGRHARVNVHTAVDHATANCVSRQRYRWSLAGNAIGILSGRTIVRPEADKARVRLANRAQLLSSNARMDVKPTVDLLANDVDFCSKIRTNFTRIGFPHNPRCARSVAEDTEWLPG